MKRSDSPPRGWRRGVALTCLTVSACSTYQVQKLGTTADKKLVAPDGIPFMLVRPEYSLSRVAPGEGEKDATYTIAVSYETDSAQAYTLRIKPGPLADAAFVMKMGVNGTLAGTSSTLSEQVTPAISALGSFSASLIGAIATRAFDADSIRAVVYRGMADQPACKGPSDVPLAPVPDAAGAMPSRPSIGEGIKTRSLEYKDDAEFTSLFHYLTEKEKACLSSVLVAVQAQADQKFKVDLSAWDAARSAYLSAHPKDTVYVNKVVKAVASNDSKAFAAFDKDNVDLSQKKDGASPALADARDGLLVGAKLAAEATSATSAAKQVDFFVSMDQPTWLARHVAYLEREGAKLEVLRLRRPELSENAELAKYIAMLQRQRAQTLGVGAQYERSLVLARFLEVIHQKTDHGGTAPATSEYVTARTELDAVLAQIDARRTRVLGDAKPAPPPPVAALKNVAIARASPQLIVDSQADGWIDGPGKDAKDYVVILKELP